LFFGATGLAWGEFQLSTLVEKSDPLLEIFYAPELVEEVSHLLISIISP
jgi:hypothetical protein